jgi:flagellar assembly protein FliH
VTTSSSRAPRNVPPPPGSATASEKASLYARFIPREELGGFAAWEPSDLSGTRRPAAAPPEPPPVDPTVVHAEEVQAARQVGYQDGYRDGLVALEGFRQSFARQTTAQVGALMDGIAAQLDGLQQEMAQALIATATKLARQIVRDELQTRPELVARVAQEALDTLLLSARHITLRVHPDDHALVAAGAADGIAARGGRLVADPAIARGGCLVESDIGVIDATIDTRWRRAAAALGRSEPWADDAPPDRSPAQERRE